MSGLSGGRRTKDKAAVVHFQCDGPDCEALHANARWAAEPREVVGIATRIVCFCSDACHAAYLRLELVATADVQHKALRRYGASKAKGEVALGKFMLQAAIDFQRQYDDVWRALLRTDAEDIADLPKTKAAEMGLIKASPLTKARMMAEDVVNTLDKLVGKAITQVGHGVRNGKPKIKNLHKVLEKADRYPHAGGAPSFLVVKDFVRTEVLFEDLSHLGGFVRQFRRLSKGQADLVAIKNRFGDDESVRLVGGYRDLLLHIAISGVACELQLHLRDFWEVAGEDGRKLYNVYLRSLLETRTDSLAVLGQWAGLRPGGKPQKSKPLASQAKIKRMFPDLQFELGDYLKSFMSFDSDGSGKIDASELLEAVRLVGHKTASKGDCDQILITYDKNSDKSLDFLEFVRVCYAIEKGTDNLGVLKKIKAKGGLSKSSLCAIQ